MYLCQSAESVVVRRREITMGRKEEGTDGPRGGAQSGEHERLASMSAICDRSHRPLLGHNAKGQGRLRSMRRV